MAHFAPKSPPRDRGLPAKRAQPVWRRAQDHVTHCILQYSSLTVPDLDQTALMYLVTSEV